MSRLSCTALTLQPIRLTQLMVGLLTFILSAQLWAEPEPAELSAEELQLINEAFGGDEKQAEPAGLSVIPQLSSASQSPTAGAGSGLELSLILDTALAAFGRAERTGSAAQLGAHDPRENGFNLQQLEMHIASNVDQLFRIESNIVYAQFGVEVEEAYLKTLSLPGALQVRAGQMLTRFGRLNPSHPHSWSFLDQPLILGKLFGPEGSRGLGAELSWLAPTHWMLELIGSVTDSRGACCMRSFLGGEGGSRELRGPQDLSLTASLRQFWSLSDAVGLLFGLSYQGGPNPSGPSNRSELFGADLNLRIRPRSQAGLSSLTWQLEWISRRRQYPRELLIDHGGYTSLVYEWSRQWSAGARWEWVSGLEADPLDPLWAQAQQRSAAQLTYRPSHFSRLRLQLNRNHPPHMPAFFSAFLGLEGVIGAHGAHDY